MKSIRGDGFPAACLRLFVQDHMCNKDVWPPQKIFWQIYLSHFWIKMYTGQNQTVTNFIREDWISCTIFWCRSRRTHIFSELMKEWVSSTDLLFVSCAGRAACVLTVPRSARCTWSCTCSFLDRQSDNQRAPSTWKKVRGGRLHIKTSFFISFVFLKKLKSWNKSRPLSLTATAKITKRILQHAN